jgi:hypothetical protein
MGVKDLLLNKGWAGRTISRAETIDRVNPVLRELTVLMHTYDAAARHLGADAPASLATSQRTLRGDLGHLAETVYSSGGVAYSGVNLEPDEFRVVGTKIEVSRTLIEAEERFAKRLSEEKAIEHQMRTRAVFENVATHSAERMKLAREIGRL